MKLNKFLRIKIILSALCLALATLRFLFYDYIVDKMDLIFIILILSSILILVIPWERIKQIKAGGIELTLNEPQIKGAINSIKIKLDAENLVKNEILQDNLRKILEQYSNNINLIRGSRILWIDDNTSKFIGERRLFRALGIGIVVASSSVVAENILNSDNDFDIIITDIQRMGKSHERVRELIEDNPFHKYEVKENLEGVNFIVKLRLDPQIKDKYLKSIPIIFYTAFNWVLLTKFTQPVREILPETAVSNTIDDLLDKVILLLIKTRSNPIDVQVEKPPTIAK